ncbi:type I restriction endonuclease subunit R [Enterococcus cecorum]|uniref:type I restriction endonuclease subunit R n=1 Tax=Enterococcus cecorum TaxID=44008 RepID=UPI000AA25186|nr:HsdR family type I site-specific deoxyribonuclease [Enterococcus cecorum]MCJ0535312.1 HsdR family type I site-specific deoxyribonuclease [Enterococcus cecorum]MCJ0555042.1 HsdR family type I site-specific deoxyribonuclease [Enterococcus cecorum]CAI3261696.1 type I restriction endonuclease subunit R [Enterococcus cecorum]CAI3298536.1 type I restriction endonuclease subunit R [Enterococcus cecorum]CAI3327922.1 type I restriction endonuclease subunit R [Enterococcus cecorum]
MVKLKNYNGRYCESDYENAFITFLEQEGWAYSSGNSIYRINKKAVLIVDDFKQFIAKTNPEFTEDEVTQIYDRVRLVGAESDFATLHLVYGWMVNGIQFVAQNGKSKMVALIDFENPKNNIFKVVNQLPIEYMDNGQKLTRRPDVMLYINGLPLCVIELKNPADAKATIYDAWEQINIRYWRDIPHLLHYCPLACISDGVKTRLGTVRTPYEHFYAWRRVNDGDKVSTLPFAETNTMIKGVYAPTRFLEIVRDYIHFQDSIYDSDEKEIVCRYPQFFAARLLKQSIIKSVVEKSGKGGTYFGATGCGKTYTMAFLARQLALRCTDLPQIGSPTIVLIVDRDDLQNQGAKVFTKSKEFLNLGEVSIVESRAQLRQELGARQSGGFYICTIQKFCDRKDDKIGLINDRNNIICFSDEAHRTQLDRSREIQFSKDADKNMKAMISKPYAKVLKEAFPQATFVGFTGTPIAETYQTFGDEIDRYTMDQSVADGLTLPIKYHPRIAKVLLDEKKVKEIEDYYKKCADEGATEEDVEASKRAMSSMEVILGEPSRLERLAMDIHDHYTAACEADPDRIQKAMIVCSNRKIAYSLLQKFKEKYPEWFVEKKVPDGASVSNEELRSLSEMPFIAMVSSVGSNDKKDMYDYLGGTKNDKRSQKLDVAFKQDKSNLRVVIVVDMWITGFDVPSLTYLYNDKPLKKHMLIQTISRVNRKYPGKEYGMVIDYIGIRENMRTALKIYGGGESIAPTVDDIEQATLLFREQLEILKMMFAGHDLTPFLSLDTAPDKRYRLLAKAAEFVFVSTEEMYSEGSQGSKPVPFKVYFLNIVKRMRSAYNICQPSGELSEEESALAQCFMAIAGFVRKMSGTTEVDTDAMNRVVAKMVEEALKYNQVESVLESGEEEDILSPEYFETLTDVKMPATKLELLITMVRKQIKEYGKVNRLEAKKFQDMLEETIAQYHERRSHLSAEEAGVTQEQASEDIIKVATEQALNLLRQMNESRESFRKMGLTFEEKAFYDILLALRDQYNFEYGTDKEVDGVIINDKCKALAKKVKEIIDVQSSIADWLNNQNIRNQLKLDIKICLVKNGYPPNYSPEVFSKVMEQVENFEENAEN